MTDQSMTARHPDAGGLSVECSCVDDVNKMLADGNGRLCETIMFSTGTTRPTIMVEKIAPRGKRPPVMLPSYCPFCGTKYPKRASPTQSGGEGV